MTTRAPEPGALGIEAELFKAADKLRGSMEPSEYKHVAALDTSDPRLPLHPTSTDHDG